MLFKSPVIQICTFSKAFTACASPAQSYLVCDVNIFLFFYTEGKNKQEAIFGKSNKRREPIQIKHSNPNSQEGSMITKSKKRSSEQEQKENQKQNSRKEK
jgi:hypothetical protein